MTRVIVRPQVNRVRVLGAFDPNYGSFEFRGSDQTWTETSPIPLNHTNFAKHIEIGEGGAISFREKGKYNIQFSAQLVKLTGGSHKAEIWLQQNGEAVAHSNTVITISGGGGTALVAAWNWLVDVEANDYVQLYWWVDEINTMKIDSRPVTSGRPEIPGVILTVSQVG
jgi:hypothetical protein